MDVDTNTTSARKADPEALMEHIRKNPPTVKSIPEVVGLLCAISTEQRSCNVLRSCVDKVLLNMSNIRTLRDIIERLRSVSRTNGFRFEIPSSASPETRCHLVSDMFSVKIVLGTSNMPDHSPIVLDVSIKHKEDYRSCTHLANLIRSGNFLEFSNHLKGLMEMYSTSGSRQSKTRIFLALQSLEADIVKMSQMYRDTHGESSVLDVAMRGTVGFLTPRLAGDRPHLAYYVSPYDLVDTSSNRRITLTNKVPKDVGLHAELAIEQRTAPCSLPITPLITNKHPIDSSGMPRFMDVSHHNTTSVQSCFVLHLKPPIPVLQKVARDLCKITGFNPTSVDGDTRSYLKLLGAEKSTYKVLMGNDCHVYHLALSDLKATLVNKVHFTHPGHVSGILNHLRKQSHLNTVVSSCIRDFIGKKKSREWYFEVSADSNIEKINVTMEHPSSKGTAFLEVKLDHTGFAACKIFTGRGDPPLCNDDFVIKVLGKCSSLPITMRKVIEQSMNNPREPDVTRSRPPALFPLNPTILTPVTNRFSHPTQQQHHVAMDTTVSTGMPTVNSASFLPTASKTAVESAPTNFPKKAMASPMLTNLLIQKAPEQEQQRENPMLLGLLKENTENATSAKLNPPGQQPGLVGGGQTQFNPTQNNLSFMGAGSNFPSMDSTNSHTMPPPSYPNVTAQSTYGSTPSPAHVPNSPYSQRSPMGVLDDMTGPVTPTNPFGIMSPGLVSPGGQNRGRRASRQKSHSIETHDFPTMDTPQYESQQSIESDMSFDMFNMGSRPGMTPLRRTESMSPSFNISTQQSFHSVLTRNISDNPLTRSASVNSVKSGRSITSPVPRNLKTPDAMVTLGSPPMFDVNQRGPRVKSFDSHSDYFRSPLASASPSTQTGLNLGLEQDTDPFSFDDNKNPSKISMSENNSQSNRAGRPSLYQSISSDKDETLREYQKTKPVLYRALTGDSMTSKADSSPLQRQLSGTGMVSSLNSTPTLTPSSAASPFDFGMTTSTTVTVIEEKPFGKPGVMDKNNNQSSQQVKSLEQTKPDKTVKRRNSNKNEDSKPTGKKRGRPPSSKDAAGKRRKVETVPPTDDSSSNPPIMLNIQLSSTGTPISSTIKTKSQPGAAPANKNVPNNNGATPPSAAPGSSVAPGNTAPGTVPNTLSFDATLEKYFQSQQEFQKRKEMKDKKGVGKSAVAKSFSTQVPTISGSVAEKGNGSQLTKTASVPRAVAAGMPAPRKRKASIKDIVDKLHSKMPEQAVGSGASPPGSSKAASEKDPGAKPKASLPYQKTAQGGFVGKAISKPPVDDKIAKVTVGHKPTKAPVSKTPANTQKQPAFNQGTAAKNNRSSGDVSGANAGSEAMDQVLKHIQDMAAASTKRHQNPIAKPVAGKVVKPAVKPRSVTPTSGNQPMQRKSPSQLMRNFSETMLRNVSLKNSSGAGRNSNAGLHRPSPTHARIATPIPANSPQSPDSRLLIIDDPALSRDDQRPDFIPGSKANERQSPERATVATPMSPPPSAQKTSAALALSVKRAPTPRNLIASPGMSPVAVSSPFSSLDDDLMNQAVTG